MDKQSLLKKRLDTIWEPPRFVEFFEEHVKRPSHMVKKGTILFNEGQPLDRLYCVKNGFVKLYRISKEGKDTTVYLFGPGNVLGLRALTSQDGCAKHNAEALTELTILSMSKSEYIQALVLHPEFLVDFAHIALQRLDYTEKKIDGFIAADVTARIANFLVDCANRFCIDQKNPYILPLPLTHQRIAEFVGSFRETVTVSLHKLEKEKIIKNEKGTIVILNIDKLKEYSNVKHKL